MNKKDFLSDPNKLLNKKPFTRGANEEFIRLFRFDVMDNEELIAEIPAFAGKTISQSQYILELDPNSHAIMYNDDLPRLSGNPNASWDEANPYRAAFSFQSEVLSQHNQYVNTKGMKFTLLNTRPTEQVHDTFVQIKDEWVDRNMDIYKERIYVEQKSVGDAALVFYFDKKGRFRTRLLSYRDGYQLIPQYDENGDLMLFSVYYKSEGKLRIDTYDDKQIYKFQHVDKDWMLIDVVKHDFEDIPVVYKRGDVAWEKGQVLIDIYELLYNIYMIIEKKVGFPILYIIGKPSLERRNDTAVMLKESSVEDNNADAKFLNPSEPKGFQELLSDLFKKIQICTSSVLVSADEIKITADVSGVAMKMLREAIYKRAQEDIRDYDEVADKMFRLFKEGVSKELGVYAQWNKCKIRAQYDVWAPQSETEIANRLVAQHSAGIISTVTAAEVSPDARPDEISRLKSQKDAEPVAVELNVGGQE